MTNNIIGNRWYAISQKVDVKIQAHMLNMLLSLTPVSDFQKFALSENKW